MPRYLAEQIPIEYHNPDHNVWLVPCWASDIDAEVIEIPHGWQYALPDDLGDPLPDAPQTVDGDF